MEITYPTTSTTTYDSSLEKFQAELSPDMRDYFHMLDLQTAECSVTDNGDLIESVFSIKGTNGEKTFITRYVEVAEGFGVYSLDWYHTTAFGMESLADGELLQEMEKLGFDEYQVDVFIEIMEHLSKRIWDSVNKGIHLE